MSAGRKRNTKGITETSLLPSETMDGDSGTDEAGRQSAHPVLRHCFRINEIPRSPNGPKGLERMFWATRRRYYQRWALLIREAMDRNFTSQPEGVKAHVSICQHRKRLLDPDNLVSSVKPVVDAMKGIIIIDDSSKHIDLEVSQKLCRPDVPHTIIQIRW